MRKLVFGFGVVIPLFSLCLVISSPGMAYAGMTLKFGHVAPPFHGQSKGVDAFAAYVKEKTKGEIEIKTFPFGQLGGESSLAEQVQGGTLDIATVSTAVLMNHVPEVAAMDLPFVFPDRATAYKVIDDREFQKKIFGYLPAKGFVGVGWTENEFRDITNSVRGIRTPQDLKGLKIRVMNSPIYIETFKQLGASPTDLPFPEIYSALQNGTIDGQESPLLTSVLIKATEVNKFATKTGHMLTECIIVVNPDLWAKLTPEQQKVFYEAGDECIKVNREVDVQLEKSLPKSGISIEEYCRQNNVKLTVLTDEERAAFKEATKPVWEKYREKITPDMMDFLLAKVKQHGGK